MFLRTPDPLEGFVDEEAITRLVARPPLEASPQAFRIAAWPTDLVLSAEEQDYAGVLAAPTIQRSPQIETAPVRLGLRRAAPPELAGSEPDQSGQRWWLAGVIGAIFTAVIALLLVALAR